MRQSHHFEQRILSHESVEGLKTTIEPLNLMSPIFQGILAAWTPEDRSVLNPVVHEFWNGVITRKMIFSEVARRIGIPRTKDNILHALGRVTLTRSGNRHGGLCSQESTCLRGRPSSL
jgi:hypothetical protein